MEYRETIRKHEIGWLAGAIDGEGCIHVCPIKRKDLNNTVRYRIMIEVTNTNPYFLRRMTEILVDLKINFRVVFGSSFYRSKKGIASVRENMRICVNHFGQVEKLLNLIVFSLTAKKEEAKRVLEFLNWRKTLFSKDSGLDWERCQLRRKAEGKMVAFKNPNWAEYIKRFSDLDKELRRLKKIRFRLQRLPRENSRILDLSKLEFVV